MREKCFFEETPSTEYGRVVEALWAQETQRGRKEFHIWAQCQWKEVYAVSSAARKELLKQHHFDNGGSDVSGSGRSGFFSRLPDAARSGSAEGPPAKRSCSDGSEKRPLSSVGLGDSSLSSIMASVGAGAAELLRDLQIDEERLLTPDI